jgi:hypothetical protein
LIVKIVTDIDSNDNEWILEKRNENSSRWSWMEIARNDLPEDRTSYVDTLCLEPGVSYKWTLFDYSPGWGNRRGDGLRCYDASDYFGYPAGCGSYLVELSGEEIVSDGRFLSEVVKEIGPVDCVDERGFHRVENPRGGRRKFARANCKGVARQIRQDVVDAESICSYPLLDGSGQILDKCKITCGSKGLGPCAQ